MRKEIRAHSWNSWQKNATQNPDFLPRAFNIEEMRKDSEAYSAALTVYNYAKSSPSGTALEGVAEELGRRFARKPRQTETKTNGK